MESLEQLDRVLTLAINSVHTPLLDELWVFFSERSVWIPLYAAVLIALYVRLGWKKATAALLCMVLTIVACDQTGNLFKFGFERLRPCFDPWMMEHGVRQLEDGWGLYGFFSAHAANAFGFAVSSLYAFEKRNTSLYNSYAVLILLWAALLSASRIFVGKHFFGDVLVGMAVGTAFGILFGNIIRIIYRYTGSDRS